MINAFLSYGFDTAAENLSCVMEDAEYVCAGYSLGWSVGERSPFSAAQPA